MNKNQMNKWIILGIIVVIICVCAFNMIGRVPVNHTGVWKRFGVVQEKSVPEGVHIKIPFVDEIETISNQVRSTKVWSSQEDKSATTSETAETKDQQLIMSYIFEIQHQLNPEQSFVVYKNYGINYEKLLIIDNALPVIKNAFAQYDSEQITTHKNDIANYIQEHLGEYTQSYGINILRVNFVSYDFTAEYDAILEERAALRAKVTNEQLRQNQERVAAQTAYDVAVKQAEQAAETARIQADNEKKIAVVKAEQEKEAKIIEANARAETNKIDADNKAYVTKTVAEAEKTARLAAAEATKAELEAQASGLNELVIQQKFLEKWDGKLIPNFGGGSGINFADFTKIYEQYLFGGEQE